MKLSKRILIATFMGFICGLICVGFASSDPSQPVTLGIKLAILAGRTLLGFTIGISALKMKWWLHGILLGFITSIPMAVPLLEQMGILIATIVMGIIYGILIEFITSILFKAKQGI
jgi:hypothetical protein